MIIPVPEEQLSVAEKCLWDAICTRDNARRELLDLIKEMADPTSTIPMLPRLELIYELCDRLQRRHEQTLRREAVERMMQYAAFPEPPTQPT